MKADLKMLVKLTSRGLTRAPTCARLTRPRPRPDSVTSMLSVRPFFSFFKSNKMICNSDWPIRLQSAKKEMCNALIFYFLSFSSTLRIQKTQNFWWVFFVCAHFSPGFVGLKFELCKVKHDFKISPFYESSCNPSLHTNNHSKTHTIQDMTDCNC